MSDGIRDKQTLDYWLTTIETEASDDLTDWESSFISDIRRKLDIFGSLTRKQEDVLERIYANKTK